MHDVRGRLDHCPFLKTHRVREAMEQVHRHDQIAGECAMDTPARRTLGCAQLDIACAAQLAATAGQRVRLRHHPIPHLVAAHVAPDLNNNAGELVAHDHGRPVRVGVVLDVNVGSANPGGLHLDEHFVPSLGAGTGVLQKGHVSRSLGCLEQAEHLYPDDS